MAGSEEHDLEFLLSNSYLLYKDVGVTRLVCKIDSLVRVELFFVLFSCHSGIDSRDGSIRLVESCVW